MPFAGGREFDWRYRREWREMLRSGRPEELASFRARYEQTKIDPSLLGLAYHLAVHRAPELHESEKDASRAWLALHHPRWLTPVVEWPPRAMEPPEDAGEPA